MSHRGIEANPDKVLSRSRMSRSKRVHYRPRTLHIPAGRAGPLLQTTEEGWANRMDNGGGGSIPRFEMLPLLPSGPRGSQTWGATAQCSSWKGKKMTRVSSPRAPVSRPSQEHLPDSLSQEATLDARKRLFPILVRRGPLPKGYDIGECWHSGT